MAVSFIKMYEQNQKSVFCNLKDRTSILKEQFQLSNYQGLSHAVVHA